MPRGFLVKRFGKASPQQTLSSPTVTQHHCPPSRVRRYSDEDRSDTSSDHELLDPSDVIRHSLFCHPGPPPLRPSLLSKSSTEGSDGDTNSPPLVRFASELSQDVPLALTTEKLSRSPPNGKIGNHVFNPIRNSALFFQRQEKNHLPSTPPPLKRNSPPTNLSLSAPVTAVTSSHKQQPQYTTPKANSCHPPKKRVADSTSTEAKSKAAKKGKVVRKLNFEQDSKSFPVSGIYIRDSDDEDTMLTSPNLPAGIKRGDIDPSLNVVVITEEARAELAKIENKIGDYVCQLCKEQYEDAFGLAQHRCSKIVHVEYRCPECDKVFNCPANLASHRRWHKPRPPPGVKSGTATNLPPKILMSSNHTKKNELKVETMKTKPRDSLGSDSESLRDASSPASASDDKDFECHLCCKKFSQYFYFRKHLLSHLTTDSNGQLENDVIQSVFSKNVQRTALSRLNITPPPVVEDNKIPLFTCTICGLHFQSKLEMEQHTFKHDELKGIQCKYCPSVFYSSAGLTRHINKHHPSENRQILPVIRPMST